MATPLTCTELPSKNGKLLDLREMTVATGTANMGRACGGGGGGMEGDLPGEQCI